MLVSLLATAGKTAPPKTVPPPPPVVDLEAMVVRGVQPGPGLWKVSKGDLCCGYWPPCHHCLSGCSGNRPKWKPSSANPNRY